TAFGWLMVSGYTGCTWAEGRAPRGRDPSADSEARIRRGRAQLVPRWTSNPGGNALNPRGLGAAPPNQQCSFPLIFRRARSGAIQGGERGVAQVLVEDGRQVHAGLLIEVPHHVLGHDVLILEVLVEIVQQGPPARVVVDRSEERR